MIKVFKTRESFDQFRNSISEESIIGLVPTMGNLHEGHLSLITKSCSENDLTILTIFVNPKQFGPNEDFNKYPRTLELDIKAVESLNLNSKIVIFAPKDNSEIYPENFKTTISVGAITQILCGKVRPTHFDGVTTVVYRLFAITMAHNAYFGQKDYQQCAIIKKMITDLEIPIYMHILPIIRNSEGLALSSRNQYLSAEEKNLALHLPKTLVEIEKIILSDKSPADFINAELKNPNWDYLEVLESKTLDAITNKTKEAVIVGAYRLGATRLLDNRLVKINA
jgi:pantoate--beta-alanine ligase